MSLAAELRERLRRPPILVAPGVFDALGALIAKQAGFEALYLSGASLAYTRLGRPDIGLVSLAETGARFGARGPGLANMVEGGKTQLASAAYDGDRFDRGR